MVIASRNPGKGPAHRICVHRELLLFVGQLVVQPRLESVEHEVVIEEPIGGNKESLRLYSGLRVSDVLVRQELSDYNDDNVEGLAEDEAKVVDVVFVVDVVGEKLKNLKNHHALLKT